MPFLRKQDTDSEPRTPTPLLQHDRTSFLRLSSQKNECNGNYSFNKSSSSPSLTNEIICRDGLPVWVESAHTDLLWKYKQRLCRCLQLIPLGLLQTMYEYSENSRISISRICIIQEREMRNCEYKHWTVLINQVLSYKFQNRFSWIRYLQNNYCKQNSFTISVLW